MSYILLAGKRLKLPPEFPAELPPEEEPVLPPPPPVLAGVDHLGVIDYRGIRTRFFAPSKDDRVGLEPWKLRFKPLLKRRFYRRARPAWHTRRFLWRPHQAA